MKKQKIFIMMKNNLKGYRSLWRDQFCRTCSLFSKEISENLRMNGHFQSKQTNPQSKNVPNLVERIFSTMLANITPSGKPLFFKSSATCSSPKRKKKKKKKTRGFFQHSRQENPPQPRKFQKWKDTNPEKKKELGYESSPHPGLETETQKL